MHGMAFGNLAQTAQFSYELEVMIFP